MRVSGAIKSILHGVTTANLTNAKSEYFKTQTNVLPRVDEGLTKRPPAEHVGDMGVALATDGSEFVKDFVIHDVAYFLVFRTTGITVYREDGQAFTVTDIAADDYLDGVEAEDIDLVVQGETVFLLNRTKPVAMVPDDTVFLKHSLLFIKGPVEQGTQIWLTANDHLDVQHTVTYTVPATVAGTGADAVAKQLAILLNALTNFTSTNRGATLNCLRTDGSDAELTLSTTVGQSQFDLNQFVIMNGVVDTIEDLPRYAYDTAVTKVQVRKDSERNNLWMQAEAIASYNRISPITPVWPAGELVNITPTWVKSDYTTSTTAPAYNGTDDHAKFLIMNDPGTIDSKAVNKIILGKVPAYNTSTSEFLTYMNIEYKSAVVPESGDHIVRMANTLNDELTVLQRTLTAAYNPSTSTWWWSNLSSPESIGETFSSSNAYDLWADAEVDGAGIPGELVEVRWEEVAEPGIDLEFDDATMPHTLRPGAVEDTFELEAVAWDPRSAGTTTRGSNPDPAFVGTTIEDITIFQDRLCFLSGDEVSMSETRNAFNFFRDTVTQLLSKHPINVRTTSPKSSKLRHFVFHNKDLIVSAGRQQFKISGENPQTPQTAAMTLTTAYNCSETMSPVSLGNSVYIPSKFGNYLNVSKYIGSNQNLKPDSADNITGHCRKFIPYDMAKLHGLPNHGLIFTHSALSDEIYVCNYDTEMTREEDGRYAWIKWDDFTDQTHRIRALSTSKNLVVAAIDTSTGLSLVSFDMDAGSDKIYLDFLKTFTSVNTTVTVDTTYNVSEADIVVVQGAGCPDPGDYVGVTSLIAGVLTLDEDMVGGTVYVGREATVQMEPNLLQVRDEGGYVNNAADLRINEFLVDLADTAAMEATEQSPYDTYDTQTFSGIVSNSLDAITDTAVTTTDKFKIGFRQKANVGTILITHKSWLPMTVTQVEWRGNYTSRGRRF